MSEPTPEDATRNHTAIEHELTQHETMRADYLSSPHADRAYQLAMEMHQADPVDERLTSLLLTASEYQAKRLLKREGPDADLTAAKYREALGFTDGLVKSEDRALRHSAQRKRGHIQVRLGDYDGAKESFGLAHTEDLGDRELAELLLAEHLLYREPKSPFHNLDTAVDLLDQAKTKFVVLDDINSTQTVERYKMLAFAKSRRFGRAALQGVKAVRPSRDLLRRALKRK